MHKDLQRILLDESEIRAAIERVAGEVTAEFEGRAFTVVSVLKGSILFVADLIRHIPIQLELAFVGASSYRESTVSGELSIEMLPADGEIEGREILLIDDILDTGRTLSRLSEELHRRGAASVKTCVFLDKPSRRAVAMQADWRCFEVEDEFVVGYGLDYAGRYRNLPFVAVLKPQLLLADGVETAPGLGGRGAR